MRAPAIATGGGLLLASALTQVPTLSVAAALGIGAVVALAGWLGWRRRVSTPVRSDDHRVIR